MDNLWNYLSHFYDIIDLRRKEQFLFANVASIYTENGCFKIFDICLSYDILDGLKILPKGNYLCIDCTKQSREIKLNELIHFAKYKHNIQPTFTAQQIVVSGILQWYYQLQVYLGHRFCLAHKSKKEKFKKNFRHLYLTIKHIKFI